MKYFIDTEFIEGTQKSIFNNKPTIDLISIGIVAEDGREYYALSKDFNLKEAWNRYDWKQKKVNDGIPGAYKDYWIRDNVLKPIWKELFYLNAHQQLNHHYIPFNQDIIEVNKLYSKSNFTYKSFKRLINKYGKTNKQIAEDIKNFVDIETAINSKLKNALENNIIASSIYPQFYGYYSDYDWVVFCWLFGKMIDLPKGFPMYCIDLKQILDEKTKNVNPLVFNLNYKSEFKPSFLNKLDWVKNHPDYPKQVSEHNALADAKWNYELYKFLNKI